MLKNVISFSLYGDNPKYWEGMLENIRLKPIIYPDWRIVVYADKRNVERLLATYLSKGVEVFEIPEVALSKHRAMFFRFAPACEKIHDRVIIRDADSRLNWRERAAVDEWIVSDKSFHIMRDHDQHTVPIMGGMWGCVPKQTRQFREELIEWQDFEMDGDQKFLRHHVWPHVKDQCLAHDLFPDKAIAYHGPHDVRPFPSHRPTEELFVGQPHGI